jgi:tetratricopeptide (TPR) repeat protein
LIIKIIIQNINNEIIDQIYDEIMSVIQLGSSSVVSSSNQTQILSTSSTGSISNTSNTANLTNNNLISSSNTANNNAKMMQYQHICCQTVFNIYDHLMRQLNYYRTKMNELQATVNASKKTNSKNSNIAIMGSKSLKEASSNEMLLIKYRDFFQLFNRFISRIPHQIISKAAFECKAYCRSLMHYELLMRNTPGAVTVQSSVININQENLIELQNLYASMDDADAASGILLLKKGSEESLGDAAFRHKINGRLNECLACIEQMLESNESAKNDIKQHENYIRTFINVGRHRNALSYLEGLMVDRAEWKEDLGIKLF